MYLVQTVRSKMLLEQILGLKLGKVQQSEGCGTPVAPHDGSATATYTYDEAAGTITLNGVGAYLGLAKAINGGELASPADAPDSVTYIAALSEDGNTLELDIEIAGGGHWSFKLARQ